MSGDCQESAIPVVNESRDGASTSSSTSWKSRGKAFRPYSYPSQSSPINALETSSTLPVIVNKPVVARLTKYIVETYQICNPEFRFSESLNPKRFLTNPSNGVLNDGYDNANSDLILHVNFELVNIERKQRYIVKDLLGHGTFGQVAKCWDPETDSFVAVKIIKNQPAYYRQAVVEVSILHMLNQKFDPDDKHHIVRMIDYFVFHRHLCISFEMLGSNLYELIKMNHFKGLSLSIVQMFSKQILHALVVMKDAGIIHCDLKPENILISTSVKPTEIKVIDFGSACMEGRTVYSYIQSRYYRSPEVLLGYPYTTSIDMWSFGCIVAELFLGLPLFPGASEYDLLKRMIDILGEQPPDYLLRDSKDTCKFFRHVGSIYHLEHDQVSKEFPSSYRVLTEEEYEARDSKKPVIGRRYFNYVTLEDIIFNYPYRKNLPDEEISKESLTRLALVDFLRGLVEFDPGKRWSPLQASGHPFVTGKPFTCPYKPFMESPRIPVIQTVTVDHNPGGGHWLAAGLSPQVSSYNKHLLHNSPHFHKAPKSYGSSYGSFGSHGSYNDNTGLASSYGSYNDVNSVHGYTSPACPSGFNMLVQVGGPFLGSSPDARYRSQPSRGKGFGVIPCGGLGPMSLGASPSQFTPPSSQMHISSASPVKYGPTYPVRAAIHGSSLGKAAVTAQYNKRSWGQPTTCIQPFGHASENGPGFCTDAMSCSNLETQYDRHVRAPFSAISASSHSNLRQQKVSVYDMSSGLTSGNQKNCLAPYVVNSILVSSNNSEISVDKQEGSSSLLDPADWDPNYSDESLLQEDNAEISAALNSEFANFLAFGDPVDAANVRSGMGRYANGHHQAHSRSNQRTDAFRQAYSFAETTSSASLDAYVGNGHPPQVYQNFPSRFRQQPVQWRSSNMHGDKSRQYCQPSHLNYNVDESPSFNNSMFSNSFTWGMGRGIGHSMTTQSRKDCGKI